MRSDGTPDRSPDLGRYDDWLAFLREQAETDPDVVLVWLGGSAATGGWDTWSDIDVEVRCNPGQAAAVHERLLARADERFDVDHVWRLPLSTWPDGRQSFVHLQPDAGALAEPTRVVDLYVADLAEPHRFLDVRRHGTPIVLHDPESRLVLRHDDQAELDTAIAEGVDQIRQRRGTAEWLVRRAVARGQLPEATLMYLRFALEPLVRLLRVQHCPWRHDFGLRYLHTDLPPDVAEQVYALVPGAAPLDELTAACFAWTDALLEQPT